MVLQLVQNQKWKLEHIKKLFFEKYFNHLALIYLTQSPYKSYYGNLIHVLNFFVNEAECIEIILSKLNFVSTALQVPYLYTEEDVTHTCYLMSPFDLNVIVQCFKSTYPDIPFAIREIQGVHNLTTKPFFVYYYYNIPVEKQEHFIFEKVKPDFPKNSLFLKRYTEIASNEIILQEIYEHIEQNSHDKEFIDFSLKQTLAEYREESRYFELLLLYKFYIKEMKSWLKVSNDYANVYRRFVMLNFPPQIPNTIFVSFLSTVEFSYNLIPLFVKSSIPSIMEFKSRNKSKFELITRLWAKTLTSKKTVIDQNEIQTYREIIQIHFWEIVRIFDAMDYIHFPERFFALLDAMKHLSYIQQALKKDDVIKLLTYAISFTKPLNVLHSIVIYTGFFITNIDVSSTLPTEILNSWTFFHNFIYSFIKDESNLFQRIVEMQQSFYEYINECYTI